MFPESPFSEKAIGTTGAQFLKIPQGARHEAMGGTAAASAEGAEALFWNPAGLAGLEPESPASLALSYGALLESTYAGAASYARPAGAGAWALGLVYFSQSAMTSYSAVGDPTGEFSPYDIALGGGYARKLGPVRVGAGLKLIRSEIAGESGTAGAVDLGIQAMHVSDVGEGPLDVGASISNLGPGLKVGEESSALPTHLRLGALWHTSPVLNSAVDLNFPVDEDPYISVGVEGFYKQPKWKGSVRLGYNQSHGRGVDGLSGVTGGVGLDLGRLRFDYAWVPFGDLGTSNRITLAFRF